jgi:hypothetical protein
MADQQFSIKTNEGTIEVYSRGRCWALRSELLRDGEADMALDVLESMVLAHASAGVDVESAAYIEGINTTLDAIANHRDD